MKCIIYMCDMKGSKISVQKPVKLSLLQPLWWQRDHMFSQIFGLLGIQLPGHLFYFISSQHDPL